MDINQLIFDNIMKEHGLVLPGDPGQTPFGNPGELTDYTREVQLIPNIWGLVTSMGLFNPFPITTTTLEVDITEDSVFILPEGPRGAPASQARGEIVDTVLFKTAHFKHEDYIYPSDVQDKKIPGTNTADSITRERSKKLELARMKHALTKEFMFMGAIKGLVVAGKNKTITDLYSKFDVTQEVIGFSLQTETTNVNARIRQAKDHIDQNMLLGTVMNTAYRYICLCSTTFFDKFAGHAKIEKYYERALDKPNADVMRKDLSYDGFLHQGVLFIKYPASAPIKGVGNVAFIADDEAYMLPTNVPDMFRVYHSPADHVDYVNTLGQEIYTWQYNHPEGEWAKIKSESNPLPINTRPQAVVKIVAGDTP